MSDIELEMGMGFSGVVKSWEVINSDGSVAQSGGGNSNLILDQGLDMPPDHFSTELTKFCAIGTGTATPNTSDTGLVNERNRTSNTAGIGNTGTFDQNGDLIESIDNQSTGVTTVEHRRTFEFSKGSLDSSTDGDYGELGFSPDNASGTNLFARTLIKDDQGNPVTVSISTDQKFRVTYSLFLEFFPQSQTSGSINVTNIGTMNYTHMIQGVAYGPRDYNYDIPTAHFKAINVFNKVSYSGLYEPAGIVSGFNGYAKLSSDVYTFASYGDANSIGGAKHTSQNTFSYIQGNHYVENEFVWDTSSFNSTVTTLTFQAHGDSEYDSIGVGYAIVFDSADRFTKDNLHELRFTYRLSWARA